MSDRFRGLLVRAASRTCAIPLAAVIETMRSPPIEHLSGAPRFVRGFAVIRGLPTPVIDLTAVLNDDEDGELSRLVTIRVGERQAALGVDAVLGVRELDASIVGAVPQLLGDANAGVMEVIGVLDAQLLTVLQTARLVPDAVWQAMERGADHS